MKVLIIEDDEDTVESVRIAFTMRWPSAHLASTHMGKTGIDLAQREAPDIIILDLGLPDMSGFDVLKQIRLFSSVPIIIVTVKGEERDVVRGLELGADDYTTKPCRQLELLARVNARMRDRNVSTEEPALSFGLLHLSPMTHQFFYGEREIRLTAIETKIMKYLMSAGGRVATYSGLAYHVWGDEYHGHVDTVRVHVRQLRKKLEADPNHPQLILTKRGLGYFLLPGKTSVGVTRDKTSLCP